MNLKQELLNIQYALNSYMIKEYGPESWASVDNFEIALDGTLEDDIVLITFTVRGGTNPTHNAFNAEIVLPNETGRKFITDGNKASLTLVINYLKGYIAALTDAA